MTLSTSDTGLEDPEILRTAVLGAAIGIVVVTLGVTIAGVLGLGLFIGTWGGGGFGFMMGGTIPFARHMDRVEAAAA